MGADEAIGEIALDRLAPPAAPRAGRAVRLPPRPRRAPAPPRPPRRRPRRAAARAADRRPRRRNRRARSPRRPTTIEALGGAGRRLRRLCPLKRTATNTVFADGNPAAPVMIIGEAPGADEDRIGRPSSAAPGSCSTACWRRSGSTARGVQITNVIYWRPPGNRKPTAAEIAACLPFVLRHIALARPAGAGAGRRHRGQRAARPVSDGITRLRGRWFDLAVPGLDQPVPTLPMFHPAFLLRSPERKREAWRDLLALKARLDGV